MVASNSRIGQMFGKYKIIGLLGKGGMGEVYEAEDTSKGRTVALKILSEQYSHNENFRTRFQRESRAAAILQEPHVIPIHDWGEIAGNLYIDMRLVRGQTLEDLLEKGPIKASRAAALIDDVASALDAAHAAGLIHRDVKPQNIIVTSTGFPYLVDFGIAEAQGDTGLTMTGTYVGTVNYMAPERFSGQGGATSAVDVYSLACVLYECLTGETPFPTGSLERAMVAHMSTAPPAPSTVNRMVSPSFDAVIARGMAKNPADRYDSAGALGRAAKRALVGGTPADAGSAHAPQGIVAAPNTMKAPAPHTMKAAAPLNTIRAPRSSYTNHYGTPPTIQPLPQAAIHQPPMIQQRPMNQPPPMVQRPPMHHPPMSGPPAPKNWVLPTVIGVSAALILGAIGIVIALQTTKEDKGVAASTTASSLTEVNAPPELSTRVPTSNVLPSPTSPPSTVPASGPPPPLLTGPDSSASHTSCDTGYQQPSQTGFGARAGRGTAETSCLFASGVLNAYWNQFGRPTPGAARVVSAAGSVPCGTVLAGGQGCDGNNFLMQCQQNAGQSYITCTGGRNARVYIF